MNLEQTKTRLENIRSVEPILAALRTISMGRWKAAQNRRGHVWDYQKGLTRLFPEILPALKRAGGLYEAARPESRKQVITLIIGSERGLCGAFNRSLVNLAHNYMADIKHRDEQAQLLVVGTMAARLLERAGIVPHQILQGSATSLPPFELAAELSQRWLAAYEAGELRRVDVLFNALLSAGRNEAWQVQLIPPFMQPDDSHVGEDYSFEPIIQTDVRALFIRILTQQVVSSLYACMLESAASENAARYQLLEDARLNIERLVDELESEAAQAYRQAITREIQNLAVGAGLLEGI